MSERYPIPATIKIRPFDIKNAVDNLILLSSTMYQAGLIFEQPQELRQPLEKPEIIELLCTFVDEQAATDWLNNEMVQKYFGEFFETSLASPLQICRYRDVIIEADNLATCQCNTHSAFLLQGRTFDYRSSLICGDCLYSLPAYKIPEEIGCEYWSRLHHHIYDIWLASDTLEKWAETQLRDYHSELNQAARKLILQIRQYYGVPAFYMIYCEEYDIDMPCPNCGSQGHLSGWDKPARICKRCKLAFGY